MTPVSQRWLPVSLLLLPLAFLLLCPFTGATEENAQKRLPQGAAASGTSSLQEWDDTIHNLEDKLEYDLKRVEKDAHGQNQTQHTSRGNQTSRLDRDLGRVRMDIRNLVGAIEAAEIELERLKTHMALEQLALKQRSAQITTEKILDDLHRGKLGVKVDYVTGKLVRRSAIRGEAINVNNNNSTAGAAVTTNAANRNTSTLDFKEEPQGENSAAASHEDKAISEEEQALEELLEAASVQDSPRAVQEDETDDKAATDPEKEKPSEKIEMNEDLRWRVKEEIESLRSGADPAILSIDLDLLLDIVKLAMTAAFFGLGAVFLRLPPTAGFLFGGMLIGPSCMDMIGAIHQVQTLAQFGSIFLLFEQGLLYSQTYSGAAVLGSTLATGRTEEITSETSTTSPPKNTDKLLFRKGSLVRKKKTSPSAQASSPTCAGGVDPTHDPNVVGTIILVLLVFTTLAIVVLTDVVSSVQEAVVVACAIALCSTTIVSENLHAAHIANSQWGKGVLKMIAMHDLFMVPLLALPEMLAFLGQFGGGNDDDEALEDEDAITFRSVSIQVALVAAFLVFSTFSAKHVIGAANLAQARMMGAKGELFTLSVVAYALLIASMSEKLKLSIEVGAILAGIILMKSPYVPKVLSSIQPITSVFGGMYLTSLGMIISPSFVADEASSIIKLVCLIAMFKMVLVSTVLNRFFDYGITACLAVGSAMAQISETSLLVMAKAQRLGLVGRKTYLLLIPTTCIMLTMAPFSAAHLRRLKMQEVSGNDDEKIPHYLCFLKHLGILRQPQFKPPQSSEELEEGRSHET